MPSTSVHRGSARAPRVTTRRLGWLLAGLLVCVCLGFPAGAGAALPPGFFGVSAVKPTEEDFKRMGKEGVGTYRFPLEWAGVQASDGAPYDWTGPDREFAAIASNGMEPLPVLHGTPGFVAGQPEVPPINSPRARQGWASFVEAAIERYGPGGEFWELNPSIPTNPVEAWQVWNEQNADYFWRRKPSPGKYASLLRLSSSAIKRVDPGADVLLGGMFGFPNGRRSIYMKDYLKRFYRLSSVREHFDGVALHPYGGTLGLLRFQVKTARKIMDRNGDASVPIWITEIGWATDGPKKFPIVRSERGQAKLLRRAFSILVNGRGRWGIQRVIWFAWRDFKLDVCRWCGAAGLLELNGNPKPALRQFTGFTARTR
jgi:polysaccharide biosynthesis protein PslG